MYLSCLKLLELRARIVKVVNSGFASENKGTMKTGNKEIMELVVGEALPTSGDIKERK